MKMPQAVMPLKTYRYRLQPGDATVYQFSITKLPSGYAGDIILYDPATQGRGDCKHAQLADIITGLEPDKYVTIGILMPHWQGSYEVMIDNLRPPRSHTVDYLVGKMQGAFPYTVAVVVLAASVLVNRPFNIVAACRAMRQGNVERLFADEPLLD